MVGSPADPRVQVGVQDVDDDVRGDDDDGEEERCSEDQTEIRPLPNGVREQEPFQAEDVLDDRYLLDEPVKVSPRTVTVTLSEFLPA